MAWRAVKAGERPATAGATVDGTRTGAVVESSVELTPSPHGSFLRHYHGPVFPHAARYFRRAVSPKILRGDRAASFLRMANLTQGRDAKGNEREAERVVDAARGLRDLPLIIEQEPSLTVSQIGARARKHARVLERQGKTSGKAHINFGRQ